MPFTPEQTKALSGKLHPDNVKKNPKGYDYIEAWHAISEMNRIFGHDGWDREMIRCVQCGEPYQDAKGNWRVGYWATVRIRVHVGDTVVVRDGTGYGSGIGKDLNDCHEGAVKEAESDAMKRALMTLGNPFGLALYDKEKHGVGADAPTEYYELIEGLNACNSVDEVKAWGESGTPKREKLSRELQSELRRLSSERLQDIKRAAEMAKMPPANGAAAPIIAAG